MKGQNHKKCRVKNEAWRLLHVRHTADVEISACIADLICEWAPSARNLASN
jgi:hypothetical protein